MYLLARFFMDRKKKTQKTPISLGFGVPGAARTRGLSLRSCGAPVLRRYA